MIFIPVTLASSRFPSSSGRFSQWLIIFLLPTIFNHSPLFPFVRFLQLLIKRRVSLKFISAERQLFGFLLTSSVLPPPSWKKFLWSRDFVNESAITGRKKQWEKNFTTWTLAPAVFFFTIIITHRHTVFFISVPSPFEI